VTVGNPHARKRRGTPVYPDPVQAVTSAAMIPALSPQRRED